MRKIYIWLSWILGSFLMAFSVKNIYEPAELVTGGFLGLAIIGEHCFNAPLWLTNLLLNIPLFILALKQGGKDLVLCTLMVTLVYTIIVGVLPTWEFVKDDIVISTLLGGMLMGAGLGLILRTGASSGGVDMISVLINKKNAKLSIPWIMFVIDAVIIVLGAIVFGIAKGVYSIASVWVVSYVTEKLLSPPKKLMKLMGMEKRNIENIAECQKR